MYLIREKEPFGSRSRGGSLEVVVVKLVAAKANLNALVTAGCVATQALAPVASDLFAVGFLS